jgi:hypothetical protein
MPKVCFVKEKKAQNKMVINGPIMNLIRLNISHKEFFASRVTIQVDHSSIGCLESGNALSIFGERIVRINECMLFILAVCSIITQDNKLSRSAPKRYKIGCACRKVTPDADAAITAICKLRICFCASIRKSISCYELLYSAKYTSSVAFSWFCLSSSQLSLKRPIQHGRQQRIQFFLRL